MLENSTAFLNTTSVLLSLVLVLVGLYYRKICKSYRFFEERGLRNPPVRFLVGNFHQVYQCGPRKLREWTREYGKTYGFFEGHLPILVTSDIEVITEIFSKQYGNFAARKKKPLDLPDDSKKVNILTAAGARWKQMRSIISPAFSPLKLREMGPVLDMTSTRFVKNFEKHEATSFDVQNLLKKYTMETIWLAAFGIDIDTQLSDEKCIYIEKTDGAVKTFLNYNLASFLTILFHEFRDFIVAIYFALQLVFYKLKSFPIVERSFLNNLFWLRESSIEIVNKRVEENAIKRDFLSLLIEAYSLSADSKKKLHVEEIKMNLALFILAGYDTSYVTLSYCFHCLAKYQEEQQKVFDEIDLLFPRDGDNTAPNTENIRQLEYLTMFIDEVQRLHVVGVNALSRRCLQETEVKGIQIPKGLTVQFDIESLHRDPALWGPVDPELFHPERFSSEHKRHPFAFMAFGSGPRQCIGMKFAYSVMKLLLVKVLRKYEIHKGENFIDTLHYRDGFVRSLDDPVSIRFEERK